MLGRQEVEEFKCVSFMPLIIIISPARVCVSGGEGGEEVEESALDSFMCFISFMRENSRKGVVFCVLVLFSVPVLRPACRRSGS